MAKTIAESSNKPPKRQLSGWMIAGLVAAVALGAAGLSVWAHRPLPDPASAGPAVPAGTLHVQQLAADILNYKGAVDLRGVVARHMPDGTFLLIDSREARMCKSTGCAAFYLPVKWTGAPPQQWDELHLHGSVVMGDEYPIFQADGLDKLGTIS